MARFSGGEFIRCLTTLLLCLILLSHSVRAQTLDNILTPQAPYKWFASTDPKRQNQDYLMLKPNETRRIPLAGGMLLRLWFTSSNPDKCEVALQNGAQNVVLLRDGKPQFGELWNKAWLLYPLQNAASGTRLRQLAANATLVVVNRDKEAMKFYYQATIDNSVRKNAAIPTGKSSQIASDWTLQPGKSHEFLTNAPVGLLEKFGLVVGSAGEGGVERRPLAQILGDLRLRGYWDGEKEAAIDVPLSWLAVGNEKIVPNSAIAELQKDHFVLRWPMPLPKIRKMELFNSGKSAIGLNILSTVRAVPEAQLPPLRFHARFGSSRTENLKPISILRASGEGAFVGLNLDMRPVAGAVRRSFVYLEGNEILAADNRVLEGTGNEDFFNSAWYFPDKTFERPFHGLTSKTLAPPTVSAYRLMIPDAVPFKKNFKLDFGHSGRNRGNDMEYRWAAFWYQKPGGNWQIEDKLAATSARNAEAKSSDAKGQNSRSMFYLAL
ncbi:MAG TPA: DUF2961 domain-containing protein, partial [Abditibacteriaceae bacterium]|nr:DUF2961 domain-containing protein [Abditibacteriaceae bacterium]